MFRADTQRRGNIHWILASPAVDFFFETTHFFAKPHFFEKPRCGLWLTSLQRSHSMPHQCNHGRGGPIIGDYIGESCVSTLINSDYYINTIMMEETMCRLRLQRNKYYAEHMSIFSITVVSQNSWRRTEKARRCESDLINLDVTTWLCLLLYKTCFSTRLASLQDLPLQDRRRRDISTKFENLESQETNLKTRIDHQVYACSCRLFLLESFLNPSWIHGNTILMQDKESRDTLIN